TMHGCAKRGEGVKVNEDIPAEHPEKNTFCIECGCVLGNRDAVAASVADGCIKCREYLEENDG
ncbi:hypothetical protein KAR91_51810, partial [Candidatus Pacearchaeota archaeon]|nr:hypothetical protein [Candidatus Pacearchaeota archaeon]